MAEYIDREMAIQAVCDNPYNIAVKTAKTIREINSIPAADVVEVRHGEWKKIELLGCEPMYECSICGKLHDQDYDYCNNCGAKMDGKDD